MSKMPPVTHLAPGHPDFESVARTITPIHRVHALSFTNTYIDAEPHGTPATRRETIEAF